MEKHFEKNNNDKKYFANFTLVRAEVAAFLILVARVPLQNFQNRQVQRGSFYQKAVAR